MFDQFEIELSAIKTRKFHLIGTDTPERRRYKQIDWPCVPPPSYAAFVDRFGCACLYRQLSYHLIRVFSAPCPHLDRKGELYLEFGGYDSGIACFKRTLLTPGQESPVFETRGVSGLFETAASFGDWFESRSRAARKHYKRKEWQHVLKGPPPFSAEEDAIVHARRKFCWRLIGVAPNGELLFEVTSNSIRVLPYLTIGIRAPNLDGGVWLPVSSIPPGTTAIIQRDIYKDIAEPHTIEAFQKPDPLPEDRERYWEFRPINVA